MPAWLDRDTIDLLGQGLAVSVVVTVITTVVSFVVGIGVGWARLSGRRAVSAAGGVFVEVFRNVPALIQIIFWAFAFPTLFPPGLRRTVFFSNPLVDRVSDLTGIDLPYYALAGCIGLVLNTAAHLAELFRAGVGTVPVERFDAARSLGASPRTVFFAIALPDGSRAAFPAISTRLVHNMKNTALVSFVAVPDLFHAAQASINASFRASEILLLTAAMYLALAALLTVVLRRVEYWLRRGRPHA